MKHKVSMISAIAVAILLAASLTALIPEDNEEEMTLGALSHIQTVSNITGVPTTAVVGEPLTLIGTVNPTGATHKDITWSIRSVGGTGATISGNVLTAPNPGTVGVTATIEQGVSNVTMISAGSKHTVVIDSDGYLWAWGDNQYGQLGDGTNVNKDLPVKIGTDRWLDASAGGNHTVAIKADGSLWTWGYNFYGQLGDGTNGNGTNKNTPVRIGTANDWTSVSAGGNHSLGIRGGGYYGGSLYAWGDNQYGQLGVGYDNNNRNVPTPEIYSSPWTHVSAGANHTVGLVFGGDDQGNVYYAWGDNQYGQLGNRPFDNRVPQPIWTGEGYEVLYLSNVLAGANHTVAIDMGGYLLTWGHNQYGQLGTGNSSNRDTPVSPVSLPSWDGWEFISVGDNHTIAAHRYLGTYVWGQNQYYQLGVDGANNNRYSPVELSYYMPQMFMSGGGTITVAGGQDGSLYAWGDGTSYVGAMGSPAYTQNFNIDVSHPTVTVMGSNVRSSDPETVPLNTTNAAIKVLPEPGYRISGINSVTMKGVLLTPGVGYTVNSDDTITISQITGSVIIAATATAINYDITVTGGTASPTSGIIGTVVTLTADEPAAGKEFDRWNVTAGGVTVVDDKFTIGIANVTVEAVWKDIIYTVTVTGGTASPEEGKIGTVITLTAGTPDPGKEFDRWNVTAGGVTLANATNASTTFTIGIANVTVEVVWKDIVYTVTVIDGTASPTSGIMNTLVTLTADEPAAGKEFDRWNVTAGGVTLANATNASTTFTIGIANVTVEAVWKDIVYTVTVIDGTADPVSGIMNTLVTLTADEPAAGKKFIGWDVTAGDVVVTDNEFRIGTKNVVIEAIWDDIVYTVTVIDGTADPVSGIMNTLVTLTADEPAAGKEFDRWNVTAGGVTLANATNASTTFTIGIANVAVEVVWKDIIYTVTVTDGEASPTSGKMGTEVTLTADEPAAGKEFDRWNVTAGGVTVVDNEFTIGTANVVVAAVWKDIIYTVTVTDGEASPTSGKMGTEVTLTADEPAAGKEFDRWNVTAGGVTVVDNEFTIGIANVEIEAVWKDIIYTVTVTDGEASPTSGKMGTPITITVGDAPLGKEFAGWIVKSGGVTLASETSESTTFTIGTANVSIEADWEFIIYHITVTGGTATPSSGIMDAHVTLAHEDAPDGKYFTGWHVVEDGGGHLAGHTFIIGTGDAEIEATWGDIPIYLVSVEGGSASPDQGPTDTEVTLTVGTAPDGMRFVGWILISGDVIISEEGKFTLGTEDVDIEADWEFITYYVTVSGGSASPTSGFIDTEVTLTLGTAPDGKRFVGWIVNSGGVTIEDDKFTIGTEDVDIEAEWEFITYYVTVSGGSASPSSGFIDTEVTLTVGTIPDGKRFAGWIVNSGGVTIEDNKFLIGTADVDIEADWEFVTYNVTVKDGKATPSSGIMGTQVTLSPDEAPTGKYFAGWDVTEYGGGSLSGNVFTIGTGNAEIEAIWEDLPIDTYSVTVIGGASAPTYGMTGTEVILTPGVAPEGQRFIGWIVTTDGGGTLSGNIFTIGTANAVIEADWEDLPDDTYSVTVIGGTASPAYGETGDKVTLTPGTAPIGKEFAGWNVAVSGGGSLSGNEFTVGNANAMIEAVWDLSIYTVTVIEGTATPSSGIMGAKVTLSPDEAPAGKYFAGWNVTDYGGGSISGNVFTIGIADAEIEAVWEALPIDTFSVTVIGGTSAPTYGPTGKEVILTPGVAPEGKEFIGWDVTEYGGGSLEDNVFTIGNANAVIEALWGDIPLGEYSVTVIDGTASSTYGPIGEKVTLTPGTAPTGKEFVGWNVAVSGGGSLSGSIFTIGNANAMIEAVWEFATYTVVVIDGTATPSSGIMGTQVTLSPDEAPAGKYFAGWNVIDAGGGSLSGNAFTIGTADAEIEAVWEALPVDTFSVTVIGGTAIPTFGPTGTEVILTPGVAPEGQQFTGWIVTTDGGGTLSGNVFTIGTANAIIEADWEDIPPGEYSIIVIGGTASSTHGLPGMTAILTPETAPIGKEFGVWKITVSGGGSLSGNVFTIGNANAMIEAVWEDVIYTVTVIGGTATPLSGIMGTQVTLSPDEAPTGKYFAGWNVIDAGGGSLSGNVFTIGIADAEIEAVWEALPIDTFSVTVIGGTSAPTYGVTGTEVILIAGVAPEGYQFIGWIVTTDGGGYLSGNVFTIGTANAIIEADWEDIPPGHYSVTVIGGTASLTHGPTGEKVTLTPGTAPTEKEFAGWKVTVSGGGTLSGDIFTIGNANAMIEAVWTDIIYTVTVTGGIASPDSGKMGTEVELTPVSPAPGKKFAGWNVIEAGGGSLSGNVFTIGTADAEIEAEWEDIPVDTFSVTVIGGTSAPTYGVTGTEVILTAGVAPEGYQFAGWIVTTDGGGYLSGDNTFVIGTDNATIEAEWVDIPANMYSVTVSGGTASSTYGPAGGKVTLTPDTPDGKELIRWKVTVSGGGSIDGNVFTIGNANAMIEAVWEDIIYTVTVTGGTASPASGIMGTEVELTPVSPAPGKKFAGWNVIEAGGGSLSGNVFTIGTADAEIEAEWEDIPVDTYSVTVIGGTSAPTYGMTGTKVTLIPGVAPEGKEFGGWDVTEYGEGSISGNVFTIGTANAIIEAVWDDIPLGEYSVTVSGGTAAPTYGPPGTEVNLTHGTAPLGKEFGGWKVIVSGGGSLEGNVFTIGNANAMIEVIWDLITYNVTVYDGSAEPASGIMGTEVTLTPDTAPTGMRFSEWNVIEYGGGSIDGNVFTIGTANAVIEAIWEEIPTFKVIVIGGTASPSSGQTGAEVELIPDSPEPGKLFLAWTVTVSGGGSIDGNVFTIGTSNATITATFGNVPPGTFSVTVYEGTAIPTYGTPGTEVDLIPITAPAGTRFDGWNVIESGGGTLSGNVFTIGTAHAEIEAIWADLPPGEYSVTVVGGTAAPDHGTVGTEVTLTHGTAPVGKEFAGWKVTVSGGGSLEDNVFTIGNANARIEAIWEYTIYDVIVIDGTAEPTSGKMGTEVTLTPDTAPTGMRFLEWNVIEYGGGSISGNVFTIGTADAEIEAVWELIPIYNVIVIYGTASPVSGPTGTDVTLTAFEAEDGKRFKEWSVTPVGNGSLSGDIFTIGTASVTITAVWEDIPPEMYTVTVIDGWADPASGTTGTEVTLIPREASAGMRFLEWNVIEDGDGSLDGNIFTIGTAHAEIEAVWEYIVYTVSVTGGTESTLSGIMNAEVTLTPGTAPAGMQFLEWDVIESGEGSIDGNIFTIGTANAEIEAVWEFITYYVTVYEGSASPTSGYIGTEVTLIPGTAPTGMRFLEWDVIEDGGGSIDGNVFTIGTADAEIEAVWEYIVYTVSVTGGTASPASGIMGTEVTLTPGEAPEGQQLTRWDVTEFGGGSILGNVFTIGTANAEIEAVWDDIMIEVTHSGELLKGATTDILEVTVNIDISLFKGVTLGGVTLVENVDYEVRSGSTIVTIFQNYLDILEAGDYLMEVIFTHTTMTTTMTILGETTGEGPDDGGSNDGGIDLMIIIIIAVAAIAAIGVAAYFLLKKKPEMPKEPEMPENKE